MDAADVWLAIGVAVLTVVLTVPATLWVNAIGQRRTHRMGNLVLAGVVAHECHNTMLELAAILSRAKSLDAGRKQQLAEVSKRLRKFVQALGPVLEARPLRTILRR